MLDMLVEEIVDILRRDPLLHMTDNRDVPRQSELIRMSQS